MPMPRQQLFQLCRRELVVAAEGRHLLKPLVPRVGPLPGAGAGHVVACHLAYPDRREESP